MTHNGDKCGGYFHRVSLFPVFIICLLLHGIFVFFFFFFFLCVCVCVCVCVIMKQNGIMSIMMMVLRGQFFSLVTSTIVCFHYLLVTRRDKVIRSDVSKDSK